MKVVYAWPPNIERIAAVIPNVSDYDGVLFAYDDAVYFPHGSDEKPLPAWLKVHEGVHLERQKLHEGGPSGWWDQYLIDPDFRFAEELAAHRAEYKAFCQFEKRGFARAQALDFIASRLAGPLYGVAITVAGAKAKILTPAPQAAREKKPNRSVQFRSESC